MSDYDVTGDRHYSANVPDCVVADVVRRYKSGGITQQQLADELTSLGWQTARRTVGNWAKGANRKNR